MLYIQHFYKAAAFFGFCGVTLFMLGVTNAESLYESKSAKILGEMFGPWFMRALVIGTGLVCFLIAWVLWDPSYFFG